MILIRNYLVEFRKQNHYTMEKLGDLIGISRNYYDSLEKGMKGQKLSFLTAYKISKALNISLEKLYSLEMNSEEEIHA